jgi:hypothetical protein
MTFMSDIEIFTVHIDMSERMLSFDKIFFYIDSYRI